MNNEDTDGNVTANLDENVDENLQEEESHAFFDDGKDDDDVEEEEDEEESVEEEGDEEDDDADDSDEGSDDDSDEGGDDKKKVDENELRFQNMELRMNQLESDKKGLQTALHQARQKNKKKKDSESDEDVVFNDEQLVGMIEEHGNDPETMLRIFKQVATQTTNDKTNAEEISKIKNTHDTYVSERWPDIDNPDSDLSKKVNQALKTLRVENHPMGNYLALSVMVTEELPNIQAEAYERGKADAMKDKGVSSKKKVNNLTPSGNKKSSKKSKLDGKLLKTANQIGLDERQRKIYAKLINKENN